MLTAAALTAVLSMANASPVHAQGHVGDCSKKEGVEKARCERHQKMAEKCGALKGEAHHVCDREFLLANPLDCKAQSGKSAAACEAEVKAFKTCEPKAGVEFM
jgi:hypothetical protein